MSSWRLTGLSRRARLPGWAAPSIRRSALALVFIGTLLLAGPTRATLTVYTSQASFVAAMGLSGIDTYDDLAIGAAIGTPLNRSAGVYDYLASTSSPDGFFTATDTGTDIWLSTNNQADSITFSSFPAAVSAVGASFFASDIAGNSTQAPFISVTVTDDDGPFTYLVSDPVPSSFVGFLSTGHLHAVTVTTATAPGAWPTVNDFLLAASPVPEISTPVLLLTGALLISVWTARQRPL